MSARTIAIKVGPAHAPPVPLLDQRILSPAASFLTAAWVITILITAALDPALFTAWLHKDSTAGAGLFENLTVAVLIPGILAGLCGLLTFRYRRPGAPRRPVAAWLSFWTLACLYFAGEECSWGQWWFGWETPDVLAERNDQGEANIHNISSWFDQKPRMLVELFIVVAGLAAPALHRLRTGRTPDPRRLFAWGAAPAMCWAAAMAFVLLKAASWIDLPYPKRVGASELREFAVAWFLSLYLISFLARLTEHAGEPPPPEPIAIGA